jgi:hypothetical protein
MMNCRGCGRKQSWPNLRYSIILSFAWQDCGKPQKTAVRIAGLQADI